MITFISGKAALQAFVGDLHGDVDRRLDQRNINASGALKASNRHEVYEQAEAIVGELSALSYWKNAGSGSPPRTVADFEDLKGWALVKGLTSDLGMAGRIAAAVQDRIYEEGSRDFRERNPNVYTEAVEAAQPRINDVLQAFLRDIDAPMATQFSKAFAA